MAPPRGKVKQVDENGLTAAQRNALRIGPCEVKGCKKGCTMYLFTHYSGAFAICECGHTQQSHAMDEVS